MINCGTKSIELLEMKSDFSQDSLWVNKFDALLPYRLQSDKEAKYN